MDSNICKRLHTLPKSELHLHLRGAMPVQVLSYLFNKYDVNDVLSRAPENHANVFRQYANIAPFLSSRRTTKQVSRLFRYKTFDQFLATYCFVGYFFREIVDFKMMVDGVIEELKAQHVVYAEITVAVSGYLKMGLPLGGLLSCLEEATATSGIRVQWIIDLVRDNGPAETLALLKAVLACPSHGIMGITLGGTEHRFPPAQFSDLYDYARNRGLRLSVHAGETLGPESVWDALLKLGVERIGHGVRALEDETLVAYLAAHDIPLEICLTSNLRTGIYPSYAEHPAKALFEAGVGITINTDDSTFFNTTLSKEYEHLLNVGVPLHGILEIIRNGFRYAFLPQSEIDTYCEALDKAQEVSRAPDSS